MDESLPYQIGDFLKLLGHPIVSWHDEFQGQQGLQDAPLIHYLGAKSYTWITKDDAAKSEHKGDIRVAGISVVWVRGLERQKGHARKNKISNKHVHRMLTDKLDSLALEVSSSKTAVYRTLSMKTGHQGDLIPVVRKVDLDKFFGTLNLST